MRGDVVTLRFKFVLPMNVILVLVLGASLAWEWARKLLKEGGHFLVKVFEGPDTPALAAVLKQNFSRCRSIKPAGSRPASQSSHPRICSGVIASNASSPWRRSQ